RLEGFTGERRQRDCARGDLALHVERAAPPDLAVSQLTAERVRRPLRRIRQHYIRVGQNQETRTVAASGQTCDEVRPLGPAGVQLALRAALLEVSAEQLCRSRFVPRRVRRVEANKL